MITIRMARQSDIENGLALIKEFTKEGLDEYGLYCDENKARYVMRSNIEHSLIMEKDGKVIGCLGGCITSGMVSTDKVFEELVWFVSKEYRKYGIKLLRELEKKCKEWGVKQILMVCLGNLQYSKMSDFYQREGFKLLESHFIKNL